MFQGTLRTKFLLSLALISGLLTWTTLMLVRQRVQVRVREEIGEGLHNSVATFQSLEQQRSSTLERSAALLAALPPLKALMTSQDLDTIQDASKVFWDLVGSQLFVLTDRAGGLMALHTSMPGLTAEEAQESVRRSLASGQTRDWWFGNGHLFEVFLQPIYFGPREENTPIGIVAVGYEIDDRVAADVARIASSRVAFRYGDELGVSTLSPAQKTDLARQVEKLGAGDGAPQQIQLDQESFLATSVRLSGGNGHPVTLTVLKSYDEATSFLRGLNRWIVMVGVAAVLCGSILVFLVSTTFTRPLEELVASVHALEEGNFAYPLKVRGTDEVSQLTSAFDRMRRRLQETQRKLLDTERFATIGRMASTISHDLRHPLTAIMAYSEFLSEGNLSEAQRKDFFQEIRIAVNRMTDEISSLLGFSKQREALQLVQVRIGDIVERAIQAVKVLPEYETIAITFVREQDCEGLVDPAKVERVMLNLLFNACEAVQPESGRIEVRSGISEQGIGITVADNGPGIPEPIRESLFQPFSSYGKAKGIGLGLAVVKKIMEDHGGEVRVESTGPGGTIFKLVFPARVAASV